MATTSQVRVASAGNTWQMVETEWAIISRLAIKWQLALSQLARAQATVAVARAASPPDLRAALESSCVFRAVVQRMFRVTIC